MLPKLLIPVLEWALAKLVPLGIDFIKAQYNISKRNEKIDDEIDAVMEAVQEANAYKATNGEDRPLPPEIEEKLRRASFDLASNFID